jgi:hypothetical protein
MLLLVIVAAALLVLAAALLVRRGRKVQSITVSTEAADTAEPGGNATNAAPSDLSGSPATSDPRVGGRAAAMARAYQEGEIDEEMLEKAARKIGISREEAERRLGSAATGAATSSRKPLSERERASRKKKNKQSRQSRKTNR